MKRISMVLMTIIMALAFIAVAGPGGASDKATKEECVAKCKEGAKLIGEIGLEAALKKFNERPGPFVWKDSYVFCFDDKDAKMLAHPMFPPAFLGQSFKQSVDPNGKKYMQEFMKMANTKGEGWVSYLFQAPSRPEPAPKTAYVLKVPSAKVIVAAAVYD